MDKKTVNRYKRYAIAYAKKHGRKKDFLLIKNMYFIDYDMQKNIINISNYNIHNYDITTILTNTKRYNTNILPLKLSKKNIYTSNIYTNNHIYYYYDIDGTLEGIYTLIENY